MYSSYRLSKSEVSRSCKWAGPRKLYELGRRVWITLSMARRVTHVMPRVVPECCEWINTSVLGAKSVVDDEFVRYFCEHHEFCIGSVERGGYQVVAPSSEDRACYVNPEGESCIFVYESIFTRVGVRVPFTEFEVEVLGECEVAPSQIHPNSWGFIRAYEVVC
ncbi:hypothetical protein PIB30_030902 [Stylosanthes scabra]|uniref:Uncharacterized protein n=1 Tax=Stylosanthes scabra TaxID=79078 RepID=A0ABU6YAI6_9FABA|nr:hypothetical protein [Stylosanthes scabra]